MADIEFTVRLGGRDVVASILDPTSDHTVPDQRGCPDCEQDAYFSGCDAPGCNGYGCPDCGTGCDLDFLDDDESQCAQALAELDDEDEECEA
jgi:hypothetical protein